MKSVLFILFVSFFSVNLNFAQSETNQEQVYVLSFPKMEQQKVKPLVGLLRPLFEKAPQFEKDNFSLFYYKSEKEITKTDIFKALENSEYTLLDLNIISLEEFKKTKDFELY